MQKRVDACVVYMYNMYCVCVVRVGLRGTNGMCAQAWGVDEDGVRLDIAEPRTGYENGKSERNTRIHKTRERKRNKAMTEDANGFQAQIIHCVIG
jgi:hypothetical protein